MGEISLRSCEVSANQEASIVFVHGLRGDPKKTWEGKTRAVEYQRSPSRTRRWLKTVSAKKGVSTKRAQDASENSRAGSAVFWPRDYLLADLPQARLWTYGYNADIINGLFEASNKNTVSQHGRDLAIKFERDVGNEVVLRTTQFNLPALICITKLPVFFVAHSLGGIIVKDVRTSHVHLDTANCID